MDIQLQDRMSIIWISSAASQTGVLGVFVEYERSQVFLICKGTRSLNDHYCNVTFRIHYQKIQILFYRSRSQENKPKFTGFLSDQIVSRHSTFKIFESPIIHSL